MSNKSKMVIPRGVRYDKKLDRTFEQYTADDRKKLIRQMRKQSERPATGLVYPEGSTAIDRLREKNPAWGKQSKGGGA